MAVGTYQGVAGLAPRPFTLGEETGPHHMVMCIAPACSSACTTGAHLCICRPIGGHLSSSSARAVAATRVTRLSFRRARAAPLLRRRRCRRCRRENSRPRATFRRARYQVYPAPCASDVGSSRLAVSRRRHAWPDCLAPLYAVYAVSSLDTGVSLRPRPKARPSGRTNKLCLCCLCN